MIHVGHVITELRKLPAKSVQLVVTSPPYWGLRAYGTDPQVWGGDPDCQHVFGEALPAKPGRGNKPGELSTSSLTNPERQDACPRPADSGCLCRCGAWLGELGNEPTPGLFIRNLVTVFLEVRRVLRDDGTLFVNLGDCYATGAGKVGKRPGGGSQGDRWSGYRGDHNGSPKHTAGIGPMTQPNRMPIEGIPSKSLLGMPWRFAFAMQDAGWILRQDNIWNKKSPMPESVQDRTTRAHEYVFHFAKRPRYFYDVFAVREGAATGDPSSSSYRANGKGNGRRKTIEVPPGMGGHTGMGDRTATHRNLRSVWTLSSQPVKKAHFATFPASIPLKCIQAGTSERGCCGACGVPWRRVTKKVRRATRPGNDTKVGRLGQHDSSPYHGHSGTIIGNRDPQRHVTETFHVGWYPGCNCVELPKLPGLPKKPRDKDLLEAWYESCEPVHLERAELCRQAEMLPTVACVVLDPFLGSGTTAMVAEYLGREWHGIELNPKYAEIARERIADGYRPPNKSSKRRVRKAMRQLQRALNFD